jgi:hypothetical protein
MPRIQMVKVAENADASISIFFIEAIHDGR